MANLLQIAHAVTPCPPGQHQIAWGRFGGRVCAHDVPGNGLPWDLPTAVCAIASLIFLVAVVGYLITLEIGDRRAER